MSSVAGLDVSLPEGWRFSRAEPVVMPADSETGAEVVELPTALIERPPSTAGAVALDPQVDAIGAQGRQRLRDSVYRRSVALADGVAATIAIILGVVLGWPPHNFLIVAVAPAIVVVSKLLGLYDREAVLLGKSTLDEAPALFQVASCFALVVWLVNGLLITGSRDRHSLLVLWVAMFVLLLGLRTIARSVAGRLAPEERCLVIGDEATCGWLRQAFARRGTLQASVAARLDPRELGEGGHEPVAPLSADDLRELAAQLRIDRIVVGSGRGAGENLIGLVRTATSLGLKVSVVPRLLEAVGSAVQFDELDGLPLLSMHRPRLSRSSQISKRVLDVTGSAAVLLVLLPLLALIALAIKLTSRGPVFFTQLRIGRGGQAFRMFKFRTMVADAEEQKARLVHLNEASGLFKISQDPRCTSIGRLLRRLSLDELPQLLNVLRGEMSLIGPRPLIVEEDRRVEGWHRRRLQLTPGMTGHWQILGSARIPLEEMVRIDYLYVTNWSLWLDVKILLRTIPYVLSRKGM